MLVLYFLQVQILFISTVNFSWMFWWVPSGWIKNSNEISSLKTSTFNISNIFHANSHPFHKNCQFLLIVLMSSICGSKIELRFPHIKHPHSMLLLDFLQVLKFYIFSCDIPLAFEEAKSLIGSRLYIHYIILKIVRERKVSGIFSFQYPSNVDLFYISLIYSVCFEEASCLIRCRFYIHYIILKTV